MQKLVLFIFFTSLIHFTGTAQTDRSIHALIDKVPLKQLPYCSSYTTEEIEKLNQNFSSDKVIAQNEDTTLNDHALFYENILDRDPELKLTETLLKKHLLLADEQLTTNTATGNYTIYYGEAFVIDQPSYYALIIEKLSISNGHLTSEKYFCTITREGKLIEKIKVLSAVNEKSNSDSPVKICVNADQTFLLTYTNSQQKKYQVSATGKITLTN